MSNMINSIKNNKFQHLHPDYGSRGRQVDATGSPPLGRQTESCSSRAIRRVRTDPAIAVRGRYGGLRYEASAKGGRPPGEPRIPPVAVRQRPRSRSRRLAATARTLPAKR